MEFLHWQDEAKRARQEDKQEILSKIDSLLEGQLQTARQMEELKQVSADNRELISQFAGILQAVLSISLDKYY